MKKSNQPGELATFGTGANQENFLAAEWLATLSHELRSPLAAIKGYATMLLRYDAAFSQAEHLEYLRFIADGSDRIESLLDTLFQVAEFEAGLVTLHLTQVDVVQVIYEVWQQLLASERVIEEDPSQLIVRQEDDESSDTQGGSFIEADRILVRQLITHLLANARKFSPEDAPIEIILARVHPLQLSENVPAYILERLTEAHQPMFELQVRDHGRGIPAEYQERIFGRFQKVDTQLTRAEDGLGLGLTLCQHIVSLHHGYIWAESAPGAGSTFRVLLPLSIELEKKDMLDDGCEKNDNTHC
jgi:signal transduction histidine kinase